MLKLPSRQWQQVPFLRAFREGLVLSRMCRPAHTSAFSTLLVFLSNIPVLTRLPRNRGHISYVVSYIKWHVSDIELLDYIDKCLYLEH